MAEATRDAKVNAALAKIVEATQVACGLADAVEQADIAQKTHGGTRFVVNMRTENYHNACVDLHQACWEWMFLTAQK